MTRTVQYFLRANSTNWHKIIVFLMFRPMVCGTHVLTTWNKINGQCYSAQATCHKIVARRSNAKASWMPFLWVTGHPSERISNTQFFLEIRMVCCAIECGWDWIKPPFFPWKYESSVLGLLKTVQHFIQISPCWNGFSATGGVVASQQMGVATWHWPSSVRPSPDSFRVYTLPISSFPDSTFWSAEIGWVNRLHSYSLFQNKMMCSPTWTCLWWPPWFCPKIPHTWIHWFYIIISAFQLVGKKHVVRVVGPGKSFEGAGHSSGLPTMRWFMVLDPEMVWFENLG